MAAGNNVHIFISTGEVSGDLQGALLIEALHRQAQAQGLTLTISAMGGDRMAAAGATLLGHTTAIGSIGLFEALPYLLPMFRLQRRVQRRLLENPPQLVIYLDYMGPNLSMGQFIRRHLPQVPTAYYIAPQQWVWSLGFKDTESLVAISDRMLAIFPQEATYYRQAGAAVTWVGHPLLDQFPTPVDPGPVRQRLGLAPGVPVVALVPASRRQEVTYVLPRMLAAAKILQAQVPGIQFLLPVSRPSLKAALAQGVAQSGLAVQLVETDPAGAIAAADVALAKSGTVNLEIALMGVPQVVTYRVNPITARIAYYLLNFRVQFVSPVNLAAEMAIVPEFIQWEAMPEAMAAAVRGLLGDTPARQAVLAGYDRLRSALGSPGACDRAAQALLTQAQAGRP